MDNQHRMIHGHHDLTLAEIDEINQLKALEATCAEEISNLMQDSSLNQRDLALARTHCELVFYYAIRAVAQPTSPWPEKQRPGPAPNPTGF